MSNYHQPPQQPYPALPSYPVPPYQSTSNHHYNQPIHQTWPSITQPQPPTYIQHPEDSSDGQGGFSDDGDSVGPLLSTTVTAQNSKTNLTQTTNKKKRLSTKEVKRRSSKACDNCRKSKCKCTRPPDSNGIIPTIGPCQNCLTTGTECTFNGASRKRGPPKGYIEAIESRLHRMEALLGGLLQNDDPRAQALLAELIGDNQVRDLLKKDLKAAAEQGSDGKIRKSWKLPDFPPISSGLASTLQSKSEVNMTDSQKALWGITNLESTTTAVAGSQAEVERTIGKDSDADDGGIDEPGGSRKQRGAMKLEIVEPSPSRSNLAIPQTERASDLSDVIGQLSLDENFELRYHGRSSGLHLLTNSQRYKDFFWQFPQPGLWPSSDGTSDSTRKPKTELELMNLVEPLQVLPSREIMVHLMELYWNFVHPILPLIYKTDFMIQFQDLLDNFDNSSYDRNLNWITALNKKGTEETRSTISILLLLVIFSLASRYSHLSSGPPIEGEYWNAGDVYLEKAKKMLHYQCTSSNLKTCQALVLLAYREIGVGAMAESWLYTGMAIRMAQDMGLYRDVDKYHMPLRKFTHAEKQSRKRVWWTCIILDKYVSTYIGRPMMVFERDYDTTFPELNESEQESEDSTLSCFNRSSSLSVLISRIISNIYAVRIRILGQSSETLLALLDQNLAHWFLDLPEHLHYNPIPLNNSSSTRSTTRKQQPTPHLLTLHAQFYTALILLHRPFIPDASAKPFGPSTNQQNPSHSICITSANAISNIAKVFGDLFGLKMAPAFMVYYVFTAAILHVYNSNFEAGIALTAKRNLLRSMNSLKEMGPTWPGAIRAYEILTGLVDLRDVNLEEPINKSIKRSISPGGVPSATSHLPQSHPQQSTATYYNPNPLDVASQQQRSYDIFGIPPGHQNPQPPVSSSGGTGGGLNDILTSYFGGSPCVTGREKVYINESSPHDQSTTSSVLLNQNNNSSDVYSSNTSSSFRVPDFFGLSNPEASTGPTVGGSRSGGDWETYYTNVGFEQQREGVGRGGYSGGQERDNGEKGGTG